MSVGFNRVITAVLKPFTRKYPGIPTSARVDPVSHQKSIEALKIAVETILRQRGDIGDSAVMVRDLEPILEQFVDYLNGGTPISGGGSGGGAISHSSLSGLAADDHPQYVTHVEGDAAYAPLSHTHLYADRDTVDILLAFKTAYATGYKEFTYAGGNLTQINIWDTPSKVTQLFTKTFTYGGGGELTQIQTSDLISLLTLTKVITYNSGNIDTITETVA